MDRSSIALVAAGAWLWVSPGMAELPCRIVPIDTAGGYGAHVTALNNWGQVVGAVLYETGPMTAYVWYRGNTRTLPPWQPGGFSFATSINNLGLIVGFAQEGQTDIPVLWLAGKIRRLPRRGSTTDGHQ